MAQLGVPGFDSKKKIHGITAGELIEKLKEVPPDTPVRSIPVRSSGVSDSVFPRIKNGFVSKYGYVLPADMYRPDKEEDTFLVVWL